MWRNGADKKGYLGGGGGGGSDGTTLNVGRECKEYILHISELYGIPGTTRFGYNNRV
jgi:hypothetical protein